MICRFEVPSGSRDLFFQRSQEGLHFEYNGGMKVSCQPPCSMSSDHASLCHILSIGVGLVACVMHLVMSPPVPTPRSRCGTMRVLRTDHDFVPHASPPGPPRSRR